MAREHVRIWLSIWDDADFVSLPSQHQRTYFALMSNKDINYAGVAPLLPGRLAQTAPDLTERKVMASLEALADSLFVVLDRTTSEVLVRTFIRWDGILKQPNVVRAMNKAFTRVYSEPIKQAIREELPKALAHTFPNGLPQGICKALSEGFGEGFTEGFREHFANSPSPFPFPLEELPKGQGSIVEFPTRDARRLTVDGLAR